MTWSSDQYARFRAERARPFHDLLALARRDPAPSRVLDLGCGTGELTAHAHAALAARETLGIDSSAEMLARTPPRAGVRFERADIASFDPRGATWDLVLSNAALHWVDDHRALFTRIASWIAPGGQLLVQMPDNDAHPAHAAAHEIARAFGVGGDRVWPVLPIEAYAALLDALGLEVACARVDVYLHHLASRDEVVEWTKGSLLTPYRARLGDAAFADFEARYRARVRELLPDTRPFPFTYRRVFLSGTRSRPS